MTWLSQFFGLFKPFQLWIVIAPWEAGLRVRLGRVARVLAPGIHLRIPMLDRVFVQSVRLRTITDSGQTIATLDGRVLTLAVAVSYAIADIRRLYETVSNPEQTLLNQVQGLIAETVAKRRAADLSPATIQDIVTLRMPSTDWGLERVRVSITTYAFVRTYRLLNYQYQSLTRLDRGMEDEGSRSQTS
ncbi:hypothetical protein BH09PLA1_BH09PLA1_26030 [soil metagenome]